MDQWNQERLQLGWYVFDLCNGSLSSWNMKVLPDSWQISDIKPFFDKMIDHSDI